MRMYCTFVQKLDQRHRQRAWMGTNCRRRHDNRRPNNVLRFPRCGDARRQSAPGRTGDRGARRDRARRYLVVNDPVEAATRLMSTAHLLDGVSTVLAEQGVGALSVRSVAAAAGGSPAQVQYYYRTKNDLVRAGFEQAGKQFLSDVVTARPDTLMDFVRLWLPLDDRRERRARVWLAYATMSAVDAELAAASAQLDEGLRQWFISARASRPRCLAAFRADRRSHHAMPHADTSPTSGARGADNSPVRLGTRGERLTIALGHRQPTDRHALRQAKTDRPSKHSVVS